MNNRKIGAILVIVLAFVILIGLVYFMFLAPVTEDEPVVEVVEQQPTETLQLPTQTPLVRQTPVIQRELTVDDVKAIASSFVERFGSYSNQSGYANIRDLMIFMSTEMQDWARGYIISLQSSNPDNSIYYGLTTKAVVVEVIDFDDVTNEASFLVQTQRQESIGDTLNTRSFQQNAKVDAIKELGIWKISRIVWQE